MARNRKEAWLLIDCELFLRQIRFWHFLTIYG
ncbi:hypothetical protein TH47_07550 [Thalassospira sp. MCCC 1A02803]|nr:hypothetical protein TH47_07550 [Thalassospira sp. MCCC 1A02803]